MPDEIPDLLVPGQVLRERWEIKVKLGGGGFGQIYIAADSKEKIDVALKAEARVSETEDVLALEATILKDMEGKPHFCKRLGCGCDPKYNFLVMELCGPSLSDLRKKSPHNCFSMPCSFNITIQCVEAMKLLHRAGYLHRDIKPSNYAMGKEKEKSKMVYMLDFGLSRKYISDKTKQIRKPREEVGFRGTVRYASITIHKGREMARVDDLWSVFYMLVEMTAGRLPWRNETDKHKVLDMKEQIGNKTLVQRFPSTIIPVIDHLDNLNYLAEPDYDFVMNQLRKGMIEFGFTGKEPFDWDNDWANCANPPPYAYNSPLPKPERAADAAQPAAPTANAAVVKKDEQPKDAVEKLPLEKVQPKPKKLSKPKPKAAPKEEKKQEESKEAFQAPEDGQCFAVPL